MNHVSNGAWYTIRLQKRKHDSLLSKLKKVDDRYNYKGMEFPTSYDAISTFEETNKVCIFKKEFDSEGKIILRQQGRLEHLTTKFKS